MKEPIKFGIILLIFCAISAGLLAYVNGITEPKIKQMEFEQTMKSYQAIFGEAADDFEEYDKAKLEEIQANYPDIQNVFVAKKGGEVVGYGINVNTNGFGGSMTNAIGILLDGDKLAGFRNITNQETKGFGTHIEGDDYVASYVGKSAAGPVEYAKDPSGENQVMWISGATVTSKAVVKGDNIAIEVYNDVLKADGGAN